MFEKIRQLTIEDTEDVIRFYANAGRYDPYYQKCFNKQDCISDIYANFKQDIASALPFGYCFGMFKKGMLVAMILAIDWFAYRDQYPELFDHMFTPTDIYTKPICEFTDKYKDGAIYVWYVATEPHNRGKGYATRLIKAVTAKCSTGLHVVSDCTYDYAVTMWLKNGYVLHNVDKDLNLDMVVKEI